MCSRGDKEKKEEFSNKKIEKGNGNMWKKIIGEIKINWGSPRLNFLFLKIIFNINTLK
jgi:hypothetical protein